MVISLLSAQAALAAIKIEPSTIDRDTKFLQQALEYLGSQSLLGLKVPQSFGGGGFDSLEYGAWQIAIARYSGALAFLQTQHQSASSFLTASDNQALQREYLPYMVKGEKLVGVGFSQLRRLGKPLVTAQVSSKGYVLSGIVPWITGGYIFDEFIIGATLADGRELYGIVPLKNTQQSSGGSIKISLPMDLIAMKSTNTVQGELCSWELTSDRVVAIKPVNSIHHRSQKNILNHSWFPLGCAYGALDIMEQIYQKKQLEFVDETKQYLQQQVENYQQRVIDGIKTQNIAFSDKLRLRAQVINLAFRCAQAAVISASGAANTLISDAGRVYRESIVFSVSGQTTDLMRESLQQLITNSRTTD